jgi:hypothetical protein
MARCAVATGVFGPGPQLVRGQTQRSGLIDLIQVGCFEFGRKRVCFKPEMAELRFRGRCRRLQRGLFRRRCPPHRADLHQAIAPKCTVGVQQCQQGRPGIRARHQWQHLVHPAKAPGRLGADLGRRAMVARTSVKTISAVVAKQILSMRIRYATEIRRLSCKYRGKLVARSRQVPLTCEQQIRPPSQASWSH